MTKLIIWKGEEKILVLHVDEFMGLKKDLLEMLDEIGVRAAAHYDLAFSVEDE